VSYDHVEMKIYVNSRPLNAHFTGIRGTVYPVIYGGCKLISVLFLDVVVIVIIKTVTELKWRAVLEHVIHRNG